MEIIKKSWSAETSYWPDGWSPDNPAFGQCAVTALVVQDLLGGDIVKTKVKGDSHYLNYCSVGGAARQFVDLTLEQWGLGTAYDSIPEYALRSNLLLDKSTNDRYQLLKLIVSRRLLETLEPISHRPVPPPAPPPPLPDPPEPEDECICCFGFGNDNCHCGYEQRRKQTEEFIKGFKPDVIRKKCTCSMPTYYYSPEGAKGHCTCGAL